VSNVHDPVRDGRQHRQSRYGLGPSRPVEISGATCGPCLENAQSSLVPRLTAILQGRKFLLTLDERDSLRFFRTQADCEAHVLARRADGGV
jgi:hypothetical protein